LRETEGERERDHQPWSGVVELDLAMAKMMVLWTTVRQRRGDGWVEVAEGADEVHQGGVEVGEVDAEAAAVQSRGGGASRRFSAP
jgi:hypothetical protein